ncbi:hypothetical protein AK812_SmicGene18279 [Symbiodinium microadriaticum]|uniref:Uncharacterized protein n=1 Tax=Symbiodinium microadriaticum TaxID=2951 RepID=A0A1Q9DVK0_SYMMI|nr:hypothetical protein AK812_SmicGene18279 [Symbiodinium microadriaticum]
MSPRPSSTKTPATFRGDTSYVSSQFGRDVEELPGYEQADHLKGQGKDKFARGEVNEAITCWLQALDSIPPSSGTRGLIGILQGSKHAEAEEKEDGRVLKMRVALLLNLALAHMRLKKFRQAVGFCDEALFDEPGNVKALYRKADALGELCDWHEAEEAAVKLQASGEEGTKLATQKREEWKRRRRQADDKQKKMWSAALDKEKAVPEQLPEAKQATQKAEIEEAWCTPKIQMMSPFDLRTKKIDWEEGEDFDDKIWKESLGRREATFYQKRALPLSLLAGVALADLDLPKQSELVVHCILDGNMAPFAEPHDWSVILKRCPEVRNVMVVYIDIGAFRPDKDGQPPQPYGTLLRPTEEGRIGDRVARAARFMGTYKEFKSHCQHLPGLVRAHIAMWADVPLYGFSEDDFATRLQALSLLSAEGTTSVVTLGGEVQEPGSLPIALRVDEQARLSMGILAVGIGFRKLAAWHWNRFVVPLDRGSQGIVAGHALVGVLAPSSKKTSFVPQTVKEVLKRPFKLPKLENPKQQQEKMAEMRDRQWQAFCQHLHSQGRKLAGPEDSDQEKKMQTMEWYKFIGGGDIAVH